MLQKLKSPQSRNPDATRKRILASAKIEFARHGLNGGRVDRIASRAKTNKRMLYHYFGNKEFLYQNAVEDAYSQFREAEASLHIENDTPVTAIKRLVAFTWQYYLEHPEFMSLVNTENLHKAAYLKKSRRIDELSKPFIERMKLLLHRGVADGLFRRDLDAVHILISVAALGYHYLNNRHTGAIVYQRDLMSTSALDDRLVFNTKAILSIVCNTETMHKMENAT